VISQWRRVLALPLALLAAGCMQPTEPPRYATNFEQIKTGMPRLKVQELLGEPYRADYRKGVVAPRPSARSEGSTERAELLQALGGAEPAWSERWQYGRFSVSDFGGLLRGSDKAFIVWFDQDAAVIAFRKPVSGAFAPTQPAASSGP
jgi:hypothetical protein